MISKQLYSLAIFAALVLGGSLHAKTVFKSRLKNYTDPNKSDFILLPSIFGFILDANDADIDQLANGCGVAIQSKFLRNTVPFDSQTTLSANKFHHVSLANINEKLYDPNDPLTFFPSATIHVGLDEKVLAKTTMSFDAQGLEDNPYGLTDESILLAFAGPILTTPMLQQTVCFFIGRNAIYAFNDANPVPNNDGTNTRRWTSFKKVADRLPNQVHELGNEYDRLNNVLRWYLDGKLVAEWDLVGYPAFADYNGQPPSPANPGITNSEVKIPNAKAGLVPREDLGEWILALSGPTHFLAESQEPGGIGQFPIGGADNYIWPKSWKFEDINEIADNQFKFLRNVTPNNPEGKVAAPTFHKVIISVEKAKKCKTKKHKKTHQR